MWGGYVWLQIRDKVKEGKEVLVTVLSAVGQEKIVGYKEMTGSG